MSRRSAGVVTPRRAGLHPQRPRSRADPSAWRRAVRAQPDEEAGLAPGGVRLSPADMHEAIAQIMPRARNRTPGPSATSALRPAHHAAIINSRLFHRPSEFLSWPGQSSMVTHPYPVNPIGAPPATSINTKGEDGLSIDIRHSAEWNPAATYSQRRTLTRDAFGPRAFLS
jgi:hypothetical protein